MPGSASPKNPIFWFIPALLACVLVLSGLCLFLIRGQARSEESLLRERERLSLDQAQQQFRQEIEAYWQKTLKEFPQTLDSYARLRRWDESLGESVFGFCLDDSGLLIYPNFQLLAPPSSAAADLKRLLAAALLEGGSELHATRPNAGTLSQEESYRRLLLAAERDQRERAIDLAWRILRDSNETWINGGVPASLPASVILLELEEISERTAARQAALADAWLALYEQGRLSLSSRALPWLQRLQEQCRRRNETESWLLREKRLFRQVRQIQWIEKFLPRLNLLLRRHLYNPARADLPVQVLNSDPSEDPFLLLCRFQSGPPMTLVGAAFDLESFCRRFEMAIDQAEWLPPEILIRVSRQDLPKMHSETLGTSLERRAGLAPAVLAEDQKQAIAQSASSPQITSLLERRILDPWAPQFLVEARPRDFHAFEQRTLRKNLLYVTLVALTIASCGLVLFLGNRALQEQQRLSKLRTDFLTNVSHELRTPLTAIRLHAETLERQLPRHTPAGTNLETILGEVDRLSLLINDVLEFTRLENDKKRYLWESVDLVAVVRDSLQIFSQQLAELEFSVSLDLPESLVLQRADRAALKQCLVNLVSNAVKFSPQEKMLAIRLKAEGDQAVLELEDRGIGVVSEDRPHIFEKFYRGAHLDPALSGTGLGLTLCKAFVEAHGGTITWQEPSSGQGSCFVIRLPL